MRTDHAPEPRADAHGKPPVSLLCPSASCEEGHHLFGIVGRDGRVALLAQPIRLDARFVSMARMGRRPPEQRFRFATPCIHKGCVQWQDDHCGVAVEVIATLGADAAPADDALPECGIRPRCRWFDQHGVSACAACPDVVREIPDEAPSAAAA